MAKGGYQERAFTSDQEATTAIRRAVRDSEGSLVKAAQILGISFRTLSRYITKLGLRDEIRALKKGLRPTDWRPAGKSTLVESHPTQRQYPRLSEMLSPKRGNAT